MPRSVRKLTGVTALVAVSLVLASCASDPAAVGGGAAPTTTAPGREHPSAGPSDDPGGSGSRTYEVWFTRGERLRNEMRSGPQTSAVGTEALRLLLAGPTADESIGGVGTVIPDGTKLLGLKVEDGIATVDLSHEYGSGGGSLSLRMRLAQVVYTLTQFDTVHGVSFELDGKPVDALSGDGIILDRPQRRSDFEDLAPAITVSGPLEGARVTSPVTITGTADTFEATVGIRILDERGKVLKQTFTTATCGSGCRGDYTTSVAFQVASEEHGTIEVYESSAEDGSDTNVVHVPVTLVP
jgi:germination protein M